MKSIEQSSIEFIDIMEHKRENEEIYHDCRIIKSVLLAEFISHYPDFEWLRDKTYGDKSKVWNKWHQAYTYYHPFMVKYTSNKKKNFDKIERLVGSGQSVRIFKYYFINEKIQG